MRVRAAAALVLVTALAGCTQSTSSSNGKFSGEQQRVADIVGDLTNDGRQSKPAGICDDLLAPALRARVAAGGKDCAAEIEKAIKDVDAFDLEVTAVTISGDTATARVRTRHADGDVVRTFRFARQSGGWRISSFG